MNTNEKYYCVCRTAISGTKEKAAVLDGAKWGAAYPVSIRFLEGDLQLQQRVKQVAREWLQYANVQLNFIDEGDANIRIAFKQGKGSWSYLGTECRTIPADQPTMNFGWLDPTSTDEVLRRVVLHEFGHALGLIHEHQSPVGGIEWNVDAVKEDLSGPPNNWDDATIENNIFKKYRPEEVIASAVDPESIMMYPIPQAWTRNGFSAGLNSELSPTDKQVIGTAYPY